MLLKDIWRQQQMDVFTLDDFEVYLGANHRRSLAVMILKDVLETTTDAP